MIYWPDRSDFDAKDKNLDPLTYGPPAIATLRDLKRDVLLSSAGADMLRSARSVEEYLPRLLASGLDYDASRTLAHLLPSRLAVWWGTLCAFHVVESTLEPLEDDALRCAAHWAANPTEANQQQARKAGDAVGLKTIAGCCATAAAHAGYLSSDSNSFQSGNPRAAAALIGVAIQFVASQARTQGSPVSVRQCIFVGIDVAAGRFPWSDLS